MPRQKITLRDHDQFLKFCRLYFQRQAIVGAAQLLQAQIQQQLQALDAELRAVAQYEGIPLEQPLRLDAAKATIGWDDPGAKV